MSEKRLSMGPVARVHPKQIVINRTPKHSFVPNQRASMGIPFGPRPNSGINMAPGMAGNIAHQGVGDMKNKRQGEKKEMQDLNDRFANYVSQVRSLEAENKALREQLKKKKKDFDPEPMKDIYQAEIDETKKLLEEANKDNAELKVHITSLEDELEDQRSLCRLHDERIDALQDKVNALNDENSQRTAECDMLRRKVQELEKQVAHWRAKYDEVYKQLQVTRSDLKDETNQRIAEYSRAETLQEELDFLRSITDAEIKEYKAMLSKEDDTNINVRQTWNDEMSKCMKELRDEYETRLNDISDDMSARYETQLHQIRESAVKTEQNTSVHTSVDRKSRSDSNQKDLRIKELESQLERMKQEIRNLTNELNKANDELDQEKDLRAAEVKKLHDEMESMLNELQMLMDAKLSLELEIAAYRKLLEGEENRLSVGHMTELAGGYRNETGDALANILQNASGSKSASESGRITMQRSSKSVLSISEIDNNGRFVTIENTSSVRNKTTMNLKGWKLNRLFSKTALMPEVNFDFIFKEYTLDAEQTVKIWAKNYEKEADTKKGDIVSTVEDWGQVNRNSTLTLFDDKEAVKATLNVKVVF